MTQEQKEELKRRLYDEKHIGDFRHNNPLVAIWFEDLCEIISELFTDKE